MVQFGIFVCKFLALCTAITIIFHTTQKGVEVVDNAISYAATTSAAVAVADE